MPLEDGDNNEEQQLNHEDRQEESLLTG